MMHRITRSLVLPAVLVAALVGCSDAPDSGAADTGLVFDTAPPPADVDATPSPICGDRRADPPEVCDDGPDNGAYGRCAADCLGPAAHCGDGVVQPDHDEVCDDGPLNGRYGHCGYGCNGPAIRCGNGFIEPEHEVCDDGDAHNGSYGRCAADCQGRAGGCGDGVVDAPWESCDDGPLNGEPGRCPADCNPVPGCGDGEVVPPEACDDGLLNGTYGHCAADCAGEGPRCGDGAVHKQEVCDDGLLNGTYGHCAADCQGPGPRCGDGLVQAGEHCDDGPLNGQLGSCHVDCRMPTPAWIAPPDHLAASVDPSGLTCADDDLLAKYMRYRLRLRGDGTAAHPGFVVIGLGDGRSIPASRREPLTHCDNHWAFASCPRPDHADARGRYNWGDGTIWLGEYIGVLALEYALFADLGLDTTETLADLRYAMLAFDRVDERAESFYPSAPPARDGFFVRDDVPIDLYRLPDGTYRWPRDDGYDGYECVSGDIICTPPQIDDGSFTSQDQSLSLVWAFALVAALVPETVDGFDYEADAVEKVHRLVWFLRKHGWKVKDPDGGQPPDAWGGNAIGYSNAFAKAANVVVGDRHGVDDYRNFASRTLGEASWAGLQLIWDATHFYNRTHALRLAATNGTWDAAKMARMALGDGKDYFALTWALMHDAQLDAPYSNWRVEALLRSAPCSGPCRDTPGCANAPGWLGETRIASAQDRLGSRHFLSLESNGLDYMGLFAAYHLYRRGRWAPAVTRPAPPAAGCGHFKGVLQLAAEGAPQDHLYDPTDPCAAADWDVTFCRRPFAAWLQDAYRGDVTVFAGGGRWECLPGQPCRVIQGGARNTAGDDLILGTPGPDDLAGGAGNDCLVAFAGDDVLQGGPGYDELWGMAGHDRLYGENSGITLSGEADVLFGGPGNDLLDGGPGKDELYGEDGDDELRGGNGDDYLMGGPGADRLRGNGGDDFLDGGPGDDSLIGDTGNDVLLGGPGRDKLDGEAGDDFLDGGPGPDFLRGGNGDDVLISGDDWETSSLDRDRLCGNGGDDTLWGGWDDDACLGGGWFLGGNDTVNGCEDGTATESECNNSAFNAW